MEKRYLLSEAKAKFGEMIRAAKAGASIVLVERGTPIYRLVPYKESKSPEELLDKLCETGAVVPASLELSKLGKAKPAPGALKRFLADRSE